MQKKTPIHIPFLVLSLFGTLFLAVGIIELSQAFHIIPEFIRFQFYEIVFVVIGIMLEMPLVIWTIKKAADQQKKGDTDHST